MGGPTLKVNLLQMRPQRWLPLYSDVATIIRDGLTKSQPLPGIRAQVLNHIGGKFPAGLKFDAPLPDEQRFIRNLFQQSRSMHRSEFSLFATVVEQQLAISRLRALLSGGVGMVSGDPAAVAMNAAGEIIPGAYVNCIKEEVTVLDINVVDCEGLIGQMDPAAVVRLKNRYFALIEAQMADKSTPGILEALQNGMGVRALFGFQPKRLDHAQHAVIVAQKILGAVENWNQERTSLEKPILNICIGINTGKAIWLPPHRDTLDVTREVAHVLQQRAQPGTIVISGTTRQALGNSFRYQEIGSTLVAGASNDGDVQIWRILEAKSDFEVQFNAWVVRAFDGDGFEVRNISNKPITMFSRDGRTQKKMESDTNIQLRIAGVDAPESDQPFGSAAQQMLQDLLVGTEVQLRIVDIDKYNRPIAYAVRMRDGLDVSLMMVQNGLAHWYPRYAKDREDLMQAEREAREARVGIWSQESALQIPPWIWRDLKKDQKIGLRSGALVFQLKTDGSYEIQVSKSVEPAPVDVPSPAARLPEREAKAIGDMGEQLHLLSISQNEPQRGINALVGNAAKK